MKYFRLNRINKDDFSKFSEDDLMFITNPGRMGDVFGFSLIMKEGKSLKAYRVGNFHNDREDDEVDFEDLESAFPNWVDSWENASDEDHNEKFRFVYMGFGNGLSVNKSIYDTFKKCLDEEVKKKSKEENIDIKDYSLIFNSWEYAVVKTANELELEIHALEK